MKSLVNTILSCAFVFGISVNALASPDDFEGRAREDRFGDREERHHERDRRFRRPHMRETVWADNGAQGSVYAFLADGRISVYVPDTGRTFAYFREQLAIGECHRRICPGDIVTIRRTGDIGTVEGVFINGDFSIDIRTYRNVRADREDLKLHEFPIRR